MFRRVSNQSVYGKVTLRTSTIYGKLGDTVGETKCLKTEDLLKALYNNIGSSLNTLLQNYSIGNIVAVNNELTEKYDNLAVTIRNNSKPQYLYYEIMRVLLSKTLDGMNQSIRQYLHLVEALSKLEQCNQYKNILDDPVKLNDYINNLKDRLYLFDVEPITMIKTIIKPQYAEYIRLYGFPSGGIFEIDKIGDILYKLQNNLPVTSIDTISPVTGYLDTNA